MVFLFGTEKMIKRKRMFEPYFNRIYYWIELNILDRIFAKRLYKTLMMSVKSGFVES